MDKLKGIDIFSFRSYIETTTGIDTGMWSILTDIFINLLFSILNVIVLIFFTILKVMESFSVYEVYKKVIYDTSLQLWKSLIGNGSGSFVTGSIVTTLFALMGIYLFIIWLLGRHNFSQKVIHVLAVIVLALGYFGTIQGTSGGLFVLDGIRSLSDEALKVVDSTTIQFSTEESIDTALDFSDSYIAQTSYQTYLYVNTGRIDGKYFNNQTEQLEEFDSAKVLGQLDIDGNFKPVLSKDREKYIDSLGHGAKENGEKNRWVSAVGDYFFMKLFYVFASIFKAIILPIPYIVIHLFRIIAEILVLVIMLVFPFILIASFIPALQNYLIGSIKLTLVSSVLPSVGSLMVLVIAVINKIIYLGFENNFQDSTSTQLLVSNFIFSFVSIAIYYIFWKYKGQILLFFSGGNQFVASSSDAVLGVGESGVDNMMKYSREFYIRHFNEFSPEEAGADVPNLPEADLPDIDEPSLPEADLPDIDEPSLPEADLPDIDEPSLPEVDLPDMQCFLPQLQVKRRNFGGLLRANFCFSEEKMAKLTSQGTKGWGSAKFCRLLTPQQGKS
ncbi:hypothetical protein RFG29_07140 [Streptococcus ruminantium]|uniref:hypothetical protein n=3 Tax=Streptococcus ruminantium TaxID=1917441 RepID=UPI00280F6FD9|nr:hypothetical protein [Streptococcus ruminantium]MDQ8818847.1 hypothetical protein [Streptococcus ruminantium]